MSFPSAKAELRRQARQARARAAAASPGAAAALAVRLAEALAFARGAVIAGYAPIGDEIDPMPLLTLLARDHACALPAVGDGKALVFRRWRPGMALMPAHFGISVPPLDSPAILPDILLVPLLAFDRRGHRLGYGGGHYDATLARLRAERPVDAIGLAYSGQEIDLVPADPWDQALDAVATERELRRFGLETPG